MAKPSLSKSGLFEIHRLKVAKSKFDTTEIDIRIPKFQNFGLGLAERERQAAEYEKELEAKMTPEEIAQAEAEVNELTADMIKNFRRTAAESKKELGNMPDGKDKEVMNLMAKMMEDVAAMMESETEDELVEEQDFTKPTDEPKDFEALTIMPDEETKWDAEAEARVDEFIRTWSKVRPQLLEEAHAYYKQLYPELKGIYGDMSSFKFTMPEPTSPQAVEDLFTINMIYLRDDGNIGVSGSCTWDDEHGFGAVIQKDKVITFGHADEGFC